MWSSYQSGVRVFVFCYCALPSVLADDAIRATHAEKYTAGTIVMRRSADVAKSLYVMTQPISMIVLGNEGKE